MKILLDTHVIIWSLTDDPRLTEEARLIISNKNNIVCYSLVSMWEIAIKNHKSPDRCPYNEIEVAGYCANAGYEPITLRLEHIGGLRNLVADAETQIVNNDPFDRLLIAQAKTEGAYIMSHDTRFSAYNEPCIMHI